MSATAVRPVTAEMPVTLATPATAGMPARVGTGTATTARKLATALSPLASSSKDACSTEIPTATGTPPTAKTQPPARTQPTAGTPAVLVALFLSELYQGISFTLGAAVDPNRFSTGSPQHFLPVHGYHHNSDLPHLTVHINGKVRSRLEDNLCNF